MTRLTRVYMDEVDWVLLSVLGVFVVVHFALFVVYGYGPFLAVGLFWGYWGARYYPFTVLSPMSGGIFKGVAS